MMRQTMLTVIMMVEIVVDCINKYYCSQCACQDETNNADCEYDGGDCCGSCILNNQCTECACLGGADVINALIGNGFCNDEFNNADCYYDGGDCWTKVIIT